MDEKIKSLKPGIVIRDISGYYDTETYDILYVHADGKCQYSNDILIIKAMPKLLPPQLIKSS